MNERACRELLNAAVAVLDAAEHEDEPKTPAMRGALVMLEDAVSSWRETAEEEAR